MNKVFVSYNSDTLETTIAVNEQPFDTSRISGKEIADWAYPFMMRKIRWNGFYDEMVEALGGEKSFNLIFEGSEEALAELKEAWEDAPVNVVSTEQRNIVTIAYDADTLSTEINVNSQPFDTSRINGKEIEDWVYPFMMRKIKWDGIFDELKKVLGTYEYDIQFFGTRDAMKALMEECPETVSITLKKDNTCKTQSSTDNAYELEEQAVSLDKEERYNESFKIRLKAADMGNVISISNLGWHYQNGYGVEQDNEIALKYYKQAADMGNAWAQVKTGFMYNNGYGCEMDEAMAFSYFMKAAEQENSEAEYWVGMCYKNSWGVPENYEKAYSYFLKAHKNKFVSGTRELALCLWNGIGCTKNKGRAQGLWNEAANKDDADSANYLGEAYFEEEKNSKAFFYFNKAYKLGKKDAAGNLAFCYEMRWDGVHRRIIEKPLNYWKIIWNNILNITFNLEKFSSHLVQVTKIIQKLLNISRRQLSTNM